MAIKTVRDVMMPEPWAIEADVSIQEAAHCMRAWDVRELLVAEDGELRGVLTDEELLVVAIAAGRDPSTIRAGDCCNPDVHCVAADDSCDRAIDYMRHHDLRRLPVLDGKQLVGTVWIADLAIALHDQPAHLSAV